MLELLEADDDVGDLHAGVVDVVLHFDRRAAEAQHADERVAERRVAQVADVRRLVRVDGRVLDDGLVRRRRRAPRSRPGEPRAQERRRDPGSSSGSRSAWPRCARCPATGPSARGQLLRDRARRLAQAPRELEGDRQREIAERAVRRVVDDDGRHDRRATGRSWSASSAVQACAEDVVNRENHRCGGLTRLARADASADGRMVAAARFARVARPSAPDRRAC